ncbi:MAG: hypothetical protein J6R42_03845, partial [Clostridia bacterium]|nr:hypothetical protein [Clostridia bacterium]
RFVKDRLRALDELQKTGTASVSECAQVFGELLGRVFSFGLEGNDALVTRVFGEGIGRFIYAADAAEDYEKDARDGNFNPFVVLYGKDGLTKEQKENIHGALLMDLCHVENAMNLLPRENNDALIHIIENTVCEGLPRRIRFLLEDVCASQQN